MGEGAARERSGAGFGLKVGGLCKVIIGQYEFSNSGYGCHTHISKPEG